MSRFALALALIACASGMARAQQPGLLGPHQLIGNPSAAAGAPVPIDIGVNLSFTGNTLNSSGAGGAPGGSNTQVQFNNSGSFGGSPNLTWVSPALTIGLSGSATGQLKMAGGTSGTITFQTQAAAGSYNYNWPTSAGTAGQPLLSGGGGAAAQTYGTLMVPAGGTGLTSGSSGGVLGFTASGTLASSVPLTLNGPLLGGGAGATPTSMLAGTDGQLVVAQSSNPPLWKTLSGDCTLSAAGAITCTKVNSVTYPSSVTSGGVLYGSSSSAISSSGALTLNGVVLGGGAGGAPTNVAAMTDGQLLVGQTSAAPLPKTISGDVTFSAAGAATIATNAVTNAKAAQMAAVTLKGNPTNATANAADFTLASLTAEASPDVNNDQLLMWSSAGGVFKKVTPSVIAAAATAGVATLNSLSGSLVIAAGPGISVAAASTTITVSSAAATSAAHALLGGM